MSQNSDEATSSKYEEAQPSATAVPLHPVISLVQRIALYETKSYFYLIGSNNTQTKCRVLKLDRTEPKALKVIDDKTEYNEREIQELLATIGQKNRHYKMGQRSNTGLIRAVSAFGIVGFVRFLEGYYIILITKRRKVAIIGHHTIYKIEDTSMVYIPNNNENLHPDESRYVRMFQNVDLSSNFYFSYSYDLTHTLQYNLTPLICTAPAASNAENLIATCFTSNVVQVANEREILPFLDSKKPVYEPPRKRFVRKHKNRDSSTENKLALNNFSGGQTFCGRAQPNWRFVWNSYLLEPVDLHADWLLFIIHGFVGQSNISVYGRPIYLTLIARRSQKFAGTRFLKRGASSEGDVANEVETEQVVHDASVSSFTSGNFTSFVQIRGSIPSSWSQDISKMVPKPAINLDLVDPYCCSAGKHFNHLLREYGAPIIVLNLVKKREKRRHESILSEEYVAIVSYLNQFLPPHYHIEHIGFDMARINKLKKANVLSRLSDISYYILKRTGIFESNYSPSEIQERYTLGGLITKFNSRLQTGIARVNCVDCLDRTNTAQFALGKCALAFQLYLLGVLPSPSLVFDTDTLRILEELYEDHGDTLALQYGGSQLVHRVKTYRKIAPLSSHSRDIMQTLSRYYSNTFSDADKQNAINLFLGIYKAFDHQTALWDMSTDYYLHNNAPAGKVVCHRNPYTCWWDEEVATCLPVAFEQICKAQGTSLIEILKLHHTNEKVDGFVELYRPYEMSGLHELFAFNIVHSVRDIMPNFATDFSPFTIRVRPGKHHETMGARKPPNPSVMGISSTTSTSSGASDSESIDSSDEDKMFHVESDESSSNDASQKPVTFEFVFHTMKQTYGLDLHEPSANDLTLYKQFVSIGKLSGVYGKSDLVLPASSLRPVCLITQSAFTSDSVYQATPPTVNQTSRDIYETYVQKGKHGATAPSTSSLVAYKRFVNGEIFC